MFDPGWGHIKSQGFKFFYKHKIPLGFKCKDFVNFCLKTLQSRQYYPLYNISY
jgi:hypothetical protein